ncbi:unnamed protein product [Rhizoctonia solani]|uniref:F-box domain-containing protein n=1 Tax=Rhizoctonia solani TaxID=456999 RepID=A0A8H3AK87_9AGAM|nr:unnamed protein product [Rhizoctonia solani]
MLARSGRALPLEIYSLIFSYLDCRNLVQLSQVCRILFDATIRHIWQEVELRQLLALLPGAYHRTDVDEPEAPAPGISSEDYCARFALYAPHVKVLNMQSSFGSCTPSRDFMAHRAGNTIGWFKLPNLEGVNIRYSYYATSHSSALYRQSSTMWAICMIPPTLKNLSFTAGTRRDLPLLGILFSMCPQLAQFKFGPDQILDWNTWNCISALPMAHELTSLEVRCARISDAGYLWLSKLPKLQDIKLYFGEHHYQLPEPDITSNYCSVTHPHAFSALRKLHISVNDKEGLQYIMRIWRTIATHVTHVTIETWDRICTLDMFSQLFSGLIANCPKTTFFHLHEYVPTSIEDDAPRLPVSHLSALQQLPLRVLRIDRALALDDDCGAIRSVGILFPELEELWLENTPIKIDDLLQATRCFPRIRRLRLCLHVVKPTLEPLSTILGDTRQFFDGGYRPHSNLALELYNRMGVNEGHAAYNATDWDFVVSLLVAHWSTVSIIESYDGIVFRHFFKIDEKIAFHLAQRAKNKCQEQ